MISDSVAVPVLEVPRLFEYLLAEDLDAVEGLAVESRAGLQHKATEAQLHCNREQPDRTQPQLQHR